MGRIPGHALILDEIKCYGCGACIAICPIDVIRMSPPIVSIDENSCTHCNLCLPACPVHALSIEVVPE
ncbi:MAG: 4Fe-4S binding protein [Candidatus Thalassarchaeaceae archaeon]